MLEVTRHHVRRSLPMLTTRLLVLLVYTAAVVLLLPVFLTATDALSALARAFPPIVKQLFAIERLDTAPGLLAVGYYQLGFVVLIGIDVAASTARDLSERCRDGRGALVLSGPVSRTGYLVENFLAALPGITVVAVASFGVVVAGLALVTGSVPLVSIAVLHVLLIPYLATCAAVGVLVATLPVDRADAVTVVVLLGLLGVEAATQGGRLAAAGLLSPTRYLDPAAILVHGRYDPMGAVVLLLAPVVLLTLAAAVLSRRSL